jgi:putative two-component system response regulator
MSIETGELQALVINDATKDCRFIDNPLVVGPPHIRFYAGVPLKNTSGHSLGSLCIIDVQPRMFSQTEQIQLANFGELVISEIELRRVTRQLRRSQETLKNTIQENSRLSVALSNLTGGVVISDPNLPDNPLVYANDSFYLMTGYSPEEVIGKNCRFLQSPKTSQKTVDDMRKAIKNHQPFNGTLLNYRKDGTPFINELSINPVFDEADNLLNFVGLQNDVTIREQALAALRESEEKFRLFAERIEDIFWMITPEDHKILYVSPAYEKIWGRPLEELSTKPYAWFESIHLDDREKFVNEVQEAKRQRRIYEHEYRIIRGDGQIRWIQGRGFPVVNADGSLECMIGVSKDITHSKAIEEALRQAQLLTQQVNETLEERVRERTTDLALSQIEILTRLVRAAKYRDDNTGQHIERVSHTAALIAQALNISSEVIKAIKQAAPLHDIGKIAIADTILLKQGELTQSEFEIMKTHADIGGDMLAGGKSDIVRMAETIARSHHEFWDGTGYPNKLAGEEIPLPGRILAVADVFDALTHERPYKTAWPVEKAVAEIINRSGQQFDPAVVKAFLSLDHQRLI